MMAVEPSASASPTRPVAVFQARGLTKTYRMGEVVVHALRGAGIVAAGALGPPERWSTLGDGYRADVEIVVWERSDTLKVPVSALFRQADGWAVFIEHGGRAAVNQVEIGQCGSAEAELLAGLDSGARVLLHPSDKVRDGGRIAMRQAPRGAGAPQ